MAYCTFYGASLGMYKVAHRGWYNCQKNGRRFPRKSNDLLKNSLRNLSGALEQAGIVLPQEIEDALEYYKLYGVDQE